MTTTAALDTSLIEVSPGAEAVCGLEIRNTGQIVESYHVEVLGEAAGWATVDPPSVSLLPGHSARIAIIFSPPRTWRTPAGEVPFAVRVLGSHDQDGGVVPEGVLRVLAYTEATAELRPRTSKGFRLAKHELAVDNRGNTPIFIDLVGTDPDDALYVTPRPNRIRVGAGQAAFAEVGLRHRRTLWRGQPVTRQFQVHVEPEEAPPMLLDGSTLQQPIFSRGFTRALVALLLLALLGTGLWFGVLKPAVGSAAKDAVRQQNQQNAAVDAANGGGPAAVDPTAEAPPSTPATAGPPATAAPPAALLPGPAYRHSFEAIGTGLVTSAGVQVPSRRTIVMTDLILQNPQGDSGRLDVVIDGVDTFHFALENLRDLDYHLASPIEIPAGRSFFIRVRCGVAGPTLAPFSGRACRDWVLVTGYTRVTR